MLCVLFVLQESILIHSQLVLQPLPLQKLQTMLWRQRLQLQAQVAGGAQSSAQRRKLTAKKHTGQAEPNFSDSYTAAHCLLFKATANPIALLTVPSVPASAESVDIKEMLADGQGLWSLKALFGESVEDAAKAVQALLKDKNVVKRLLNAPGTADGANAADGEAAGDGRFAAVEAGQLKGPPGLEGHVPQQQEGSSAVLAPPPPPAAADMVSDESTAGDAAGQGAGAAAGVEVDGVAQPIMSLARREAERVGRHPVGLGAASQSQLSPKQLSKVLLDLFDVWHAVLTQQQQAHEREQQRVRYQQECEEALLQTGMDLLAAQEEARQTAERRAQQQEEESRASATAGKAAGKDGSLWWRQQELPAVFGSSSEEASMQLECVSAAAGELVEKLAGKQGILCAGAALHLHLSLLS
jgi:hypothetical protein